MQLKENDPDAFDMLVKHPIRYYDIGKDYVDFNQLTQHPIIRQKHLRVQFYGLDSNRCNTIFKVRNL